MPQYPSRKHPLLKVLKQGDIAAKHHSLSPLAGNVVKRVKAPSLTALGPGPHVWGKHLSRVLRAPSSAPNSAQAGVIDAVEAQPGPCQRLVRTRFTARCHRPLAVQSPTLTEPLEPPARATGRKYSQDTVTLSSVDCATALLTMSRMGRGSGQDVTMSPKLGHPKHSVLPPVLSPHHLEPYMMEASRRAQGDCVVSLRKSPHGCSVAASHQPQLRVLVTFTTGHRPPRERHTCCNPRSHQT